jgi:hypothetical protein
MAERPPGLRGKRIALGFVITVTVVFIGASALQIVPAAFGPGVTPLPLAPPGTPARVCADGVRSLAVAVDRASSQTLSLSASAADDTETAVAQFRRNLAPDWDDQARVEAACAGSPEGDSAWAALLRLREAEEQLVRKGRVELRPLRADLAAHLPGARSLP